MLFSQDRTALRSMYRTAWDKAVREQPLSELERQIVAVIRDHPEYQAAVINDGHVDYHPELGQTNPFLHMSLHLAVRDQLATGRPAGIVEVFDVLVLRCGARHDAEHLLSEFMGRELWEAQRDGRMPDEQRYLQSLREHAGLKDA